MALRRSYHPARTERSESIPGSSLAKDVIVTTLEAIPHQFLVLLGIEWREAARWTVRNRDMVAAWTIFLRSVSGSAHAPA